MASSGRQSNGRSPLVNQQRQITSFFSKQTTKIISGVKPRADCSSDSNRSPTPTPTTPSPLQSKLKKPLLVVGAPPASSCTPPTQKSVGSDVVGRRVRVYWPLDKSWYEGCVKLFDEHAGKHLVQYDDGEEEMLELNKEKIEWVEQSVKRFKRLRRGSFGSLGLKSPVMKDDLAVVEDDLVEKVDDGMENDAADDSSDEDWLDIGDNKAVEEENMESLDDDHEEEDDVMERSKRKQKGKNNSRKRKGNGGQVKSAKKNKTGGADADQSAFVVSSMEHKSNTASDNTFNGVNHATGDTTERFSLRDAEKLWFLDKDRRDARQRRSGDVDFDPRTLYLPPDFLKSLSGGQRQWWEFKSKHMDKVLFFKMGKFYELFEMDAHIAAKELDLHYMKGEQPHCGFPEKNFSMNLEKLVQKGYRVLVVEQTETPEQLELRRKEKGSTDKVVRREICAVVTKGTLTEGDFLSANYDASFIMAITENCQSLASPNSNRAFGVCMVDVTTSRVILGQFVDDSECNALCRILSELKPVEIVKPAKLLSLETEKILLNHTRSPLVNELLPHIEFWDAEKTVQEVKNIYGRIIDHSISGSLTQESFPVINSPSSLDELNCLPDVLSKLLSMGEGGCWALSALGGALFYLKQCFLDETLLKFAHFELLPCSDFSDFISKPYMVLDAAALENLEVFYNCQNGDSAGTLYAQLNHCVTAPGKRLLKTWLARPLYNLESIKERQNVVAILRGDNLSFALEFRKTLSKVPDVERLLARVFSYSEGNGRNAKKVVLYEDAARKQLQEFICALRGCESMFQACFSLSTILNNVESKTLHHLLTPGERLPDLHSVISHFKDSFDWVEANNSGRIIPHESIDLEYDSACEKIKETESSLAKYLKEQRKILGGASISYVTIGKEAYLLEVPESLRGSIAKDYELRSSRKGYFRYWTPKIKKLLSDLSQAESEKESSLKTILQRLIGKFCEHHMKWRELVSVTAEIDVLISLAISRDYYEGPTCQPTFLKSASPDEVPCFFAKTLGHPVLRTDSLGRGTFVSNDVSVGGSEFSNFILLTGPNMGGKSTLLRQVCLSVILAQVGADVPAERFDLSPVDRIFVRMGAKDHIMAGQSTFLTELSETAAMLALATRNSLVALDELGRGTSTSDGQAIAASVLEHFVSKVQCRGMFSTHYHQLAIDYQNDPRVALCHMACHVGRGIDGGEEVTFLYRLTPGACPKSYGVNVARLAGLPNSVLEKAADKSREFEATHGKLRKVAGQNSSDQTRVDEVVAITRELIEFSYNSPCNEPKDGGISSLSKLQNRTRRLLQNPHSTGVASGVNTLQPFFQTNDVALPI